MLRNAKDKACPSRTRRAGASLVLLAVVRQKGAGYAVSLRDEIAERTGIELGRGSVYVTLDRLVRKGLVTSRLGDPTPERGGKARRMFAITAAGQRALSAVETALARMRPARGTR